MSKTDKDRPMWVRGLDPLEPRRKAYHYHRSWRGEVFDCDLDRDHPEHRSSIGEQYCNWWISGWYYTTHVPRWYRAHTWYEPERTRERVDLRRAVKEFNAGEDLEDFDFPNFQHRHRSQWYWD